MAFKFPWSDKRAGAAGDRAWPVSGSSACTYSPGPGVGREPAAALLFIPNPAPKKLGKRMENDDLLKTQNSLQDMFVAIIL